MIPHRGRVLRLACRMRITGDVVVHNTACRRPMRSGGEP